MHTNGTTLDPDMGLDYQYGACATRQSPASIRCSRPFTKRGLVVSGKIRRSLINFVYRGLKGNQL